MNPIERMLRSLDQLQQRHSLLGFPVAVVRKFGDDWGGKHAALLAYYGFVSLFPLLLVFVTVTGYVLDGDPDLQQRLIDTAMDQLPVLGPQVQGAVHAIQGSGVGLAVGLAGTLWGGLAITQTAQDALNAVWNIPRSQRPNLWLRSARSLGAVLVVVAALFSATALAGLGAIWPDVIGSVQPLAGSLVLNFLLLVVMFQLLMARPVPWTQLIPGAAAGAVVWSALQIGGVAIVNRQLARADVLYGAFATVLVLLAWMHLSARLFIYAAELNVVLARRLWPRSLLQPPLTEQDRQVLTAVAKTEQLRPEQRVDVAFVTEADDRVDRRSSGSDDACASHPSDSAS